MDDFETALVYSLIYAVHSSKAEEMLWLGISFMLYVHSPKAEEML